MWSNLNKQLIKRRQTQRTAVTISISALRWGGSSRFRQLLLDLIVHNLVMRAAAGPSRALAQAPEPGHHEQRCWRNNATVRRIGVRHASTCMGANLVGTVATRYVYAAPRMSRAPRKTVYMKHTARESLSLIKYHAVKTYCMREVTHNPFLTSAPE
jgi:hypothetical protein